MQNIVWFAASDTLTIKLELAKIRPVIGSFNAPYKTTNGYNRVGGLIFAYDSDLCMKGC
jgi:hypothetical protein